MKLTELIVCIAILLLSVIVFSNTFSNIRNNISDSNKLIMANKKKLYTDLLIRNKLESIKVPYWKSFDKEFNNIQADLMLFAKENNINISSITSIYNNKYNSDGIKVEWDLNGNSFITIEYIKQRIIND